MPETTMPWGQLKSDGRARGFLVKQLYAVFSEPVEGLGQVLANLDAHADYQVHLEEIGVMWAAGPFSDDAEESWEGHGFFVYRAESRQRAVEYAEADPMHSSGARRFRVRPWLLNEGSFQMRVNYSTGAAQVL